MKTVEGIMMCAFVNAGQGVGEAYGDSENWRLVFQKRD